MHCRCYHYCVECFRCAWLLKVERVDSWRPQWRLTFNQLSAAVQHSAASYIGIALISSVAIGWETSIVRNADHLEPTGKMSLDQGG